MCSKGDASSVCPNQSCRVIEVPQVEDCLQPVINVVPLQVCLQCIFLVFFYPYKDFLILVSKILLLLVCISLYKVTLHVDSDSLLFHELLRCFLFCLNINIDV